MLGNVDIAVFMEQKRVFEALKLSKLGLVAHKHGRLEDYSLQDLLDHFEEEVEELGIAFCLGDPQNITEELADISNTIDFIFTFLKPTRENTSS